MDYFVTYEEYTYETSPPCQEDHAHHYCDQGSSAVSVTLRTLHATPPSGPHEAIYGEGTLYGCDDLAPGNMAYVVLVNYTDGDTFGSSGYWKIAAVKSTPDRAKDAERACENPSEDGKWRSWDGYFASLNSVEVVPMVVLA